MQYRSRGAFSERRNAKARRFKRGEKNGVAIARDEPNLASGAAILGAAFKTHDQERFECRKANRDWTFKLYFERKNASIAANYSTVVAFKM